MSCACSCKFQLALFFSAFRITLVIQVFQCFFLIESHAICNPLLCLIQLMVLTLSLVLHDSLSRRSLSLNGTIHSMVLKQSSESHAFLIVFNYLVNPYVSLYGMLPYTELFKTLYCQRRTL